jgi:pantothenate kinase
MSGKQTAAKSPEIGTFVAFGEFDESIESAVAIGIDSGATLLKLCVLDSAGELHFATWPSPSTTRVIDLLDRLAPDRIGVTGCGAAAIIEKLTREVSHPIEFDAWGRGANEILAESGLTSDDPYLLISIGTGTSALRVAGDQARRLAWGSRSRVVAVMGNWSRSHRAAIEEASTC